MQDYSPQVRDALSQAPEGTWKEFSAFAGPRLQKLTAWDKCVLLGDASHPLSGQFSRITLLKMCLYADAALRRIRIRCRLRA